MSSERKRRGPRKVEPDQPPDLDAILSPHRDRILGWAMQGLGSKSIADRLEGVATPSQVYRWLAQSENVVLLEAARHETMQATLRAAVTALPLGIATAVRIIQTEDSADRDKLAATRTIAQMVGTDRIIRALDAAETVVEDSAKLSLRDRVAEMMERARRENVEGGPPQLRAIEGGGSAGTDDDAGD